MTNDRWNEKQADYWNKIAPKYDHLYDSKWSAWEDSQTENWLHSFYDQHVGKVLDLGCGTGLGYQLTMRCSTEFHYFGIDVSSEMARAVKVKYPRATIVCSPMSDLSSFDNEMFDYVICLNTAFSFTHDPIGTLAEVRRVLVPRGRIFLSMLNRTSLRRIVRAKFARKEAFITRGASSTIGIVPGYTYTRNEIVALLGQEGFRVERIVGQGVLAGTIETERLVWLEKRLSKFSPSLSHLFNIFGKKNG